MAAGGGNMNAGFGVISYNMSVFSAMGDTKSVFASEYSFLQRATVTAQGPTDFFMNALTHLHKNATAPAINAKVIGIQEFHPPTLDMIMGKLNTNNNFTYHAFSKEIMNKASVLTIWDKELLGDISGSAYDEDLGLTEGLLPNDKGRPISIIKTIKGYALINFHGINRPRYYGAQPKDGSRPAGQEEGVETGVDNSHILKDLISKHAAAAGLDKIDSKKIIIMCDSNDREHGINSETPLIIQTLQGPIGFHDGRTKEDKSQKSCCYNWDSCGIPISGGKKTLGDAGAESKYAYTGDYVLAANFKVAVTAVQSPLDDEKNIERGASIASDHKLVYAILPMPMAGGRRKMRKTRKTKEKKFKKSRKI